MYQNARFGLISVVIIATIGARASGQAINEDRKLMAVDGAAGDEFGYCVAIDQGVIAVGAPGDDDNGVDSGAAYLCNASTGAQIAKLLPDDGAAGDGFGFSIAIGDGVVAIGAPHDDHDGIASGSAYLFDASTGAQLGKLTPIDGAAGDEFGYSIAIDSGVVAVGAMRNDDLGDSSGSAYLFDASTGNQLDKLLPDAGAANQNFGVSIAMDGGIVAIGSRMYFVLGEGFTLGTVYLFDVSTGDQINELRAGNGTWTDFFADSVDIDNGLVAVGAWARSIFFDHSGAAYVFDASSGSQISYIVPSDGHDRDNFGVSVSIDDGVVAIGSHQDGDNGWVAGSAYLYDALSGTQIDKLLASDGAAFDLFGTSVAIEGGVVVVGAIGDEDNGADSGSLYVFGESGLIPGDVNRDGALDVGDVLPFVAVAIGEDNNPDHLTACDMNADGVCNGDDIQTFVDAILAG